MLLLGLFVFASWQYGPWDARGLAGDRPLAASREGTGPMKTFGWKELPRLKRWGPAVALAALLASEAFAAVSPSRANNPAMAAEETNPLVTFDRSMEALVDRVTPTVVNITITSERNPRRITGGESGESNPLERFFGPNSPFGPLPPARRGPRTERGLGSGVIISPDGYIVTNNHVVEGAVSIRVTTSNRDVHAAKLVGSDPLTDISVIKIEGDGLPHLTWGDSSKLRPGQTVLAFGNPYGFSFSVTRGIVSALNRPNITSDRYRPGEFIQTDAAINQGNSGGALVDVSGQVIGINTFLISPTGTFSGMGFAIPAAIARPIAEKLIRDGKVEHGFIGVSISDVTPENARFFNMTKPRGALVTDVAPDAPGAKAGLRTGDVITALDGKPLLDSGELQMEVVLRSPGDSIRLEVARDGKVLTVPVTLEPRKGELDPKSMEDASGKGRWGLDLQDLTPDLRRQIQIPDEVKGAVVLAVRTGSPADDAGLSPGDVIVAVNRKATPTLGDVADELRGIPQGEDALVLVWSRGGRTFRVLHPGEG